MKLAGTTILEMERVLQWTNIGLDINEVSRYYYLRNGTSFTMNEYRIRDKWSKQVLLS